MPWISFDDIAARRVEAHSDGNNYTFEQLEALPPSLSPRDHNFYAILGDDDLVFGPGETAHILSDYGAGGVLFNLGQNILPGDPIAISAHGRNSPLSLGDLTNLVNYNDGTFGMRNGATDWLAGRNLLNDGDSLTYQTLEGSFELMRFNVEVPVRFGREAAPATLLLDVDGDIVRNGLGQSEGLAVGSGIVEDALFAIEGLADGDLVEIDLLAGEVRVNGVVLDDTADFFAAFQASERDTLTVGSPDIGIGLTDVALAVTSPYSLEIDESQSELTIGGPLLEGADGVEASPISGTLDLERGTTGNQLIVGSTTQEAAIEGTFDEGEAAISFSESFDILIAELSLTLGGNITGVEVDFDYELQSDVVAPDVAPEISLEVRDLSVFIEGTISGGLFVDFPPDNFFFNFPDDFSLDGDIDYSVELTADGPLAIPNPTPVEAEFDALGRMTSFAAPLSTTLAEAGINAGNSTISVEFGDLFESNDEIVNAAKDVIDGFIFEAIDQDVVALLGELEIGGQIIADTPDLVL